MAQNVPGRIDTTPLRTKPTWSELRAFAKADRKSAPAGSRGAGRARSVVVFVAWLFVGSFVISMIVSIVFSVVAFDQMAANTVFFAGASDQSTQIITSVVAVGLYVAVLVLWVVVAHRRRLRERWRLANFAQVNGMSYIRSVSAPQFPGTIFRRGYNRTAHDVIRAAGPRFIEIGNYRFFVRTNSDRNDEEHRWGYVAIRLDTPLPHMLLDATGNNGLFGANLIASFRRDQRLSLEGDFDRYFALYCPREYETDALYIFTPDVMRRFIDHAAEFDIEIVDDWMFLYSRRDLSVPDPASWEWLFPTIHALVDKVDGWGRWRDQRLSGAVPSSADDPSVVGPPPGVAPGGRRLRTSSSRWAAIVPVLSILAFVVALWHILT